ncbi:MAG: tRNA dihydrouridine synthase DusB [Elusimicrobium sp.]|uniref:tRNA-dihydrouridine synthase n=1 Tax=Candidatus Avelusimicrobium gallicola TaxID=2562704 RepID=A0A928DQD5_9BACT|nr:tRNA dihydrouridine synthase DusB [Elusimicrobium sp.]
MTILSPLQIGQVKLTNNLILAPMAGITDSPFRVLCLQGGAGLVCAEMVSAHALHYGNEKSGRMLQVNPKEHPVSMQIFGSDEQTIAEAAKNAEAAGADIVDLNAGCPVKKINKAGAGCVLMKDEAKLARLLSAAVKSVKIPVTLKTRIALNHKELLAVRLAKLAEDCGAAAVTLHARAAADVHSGQPNVAAVAEACAAVKIPVIGNGGIKDASLVKEFLQAGCSGVMIGRGAVGNPFIFQDITDELAGKKPASQDPKKRLEIYLSLVKENASFYGERIGVNRSRKTAGYWIKDFPNASEVRGKFVRLDSLSEIETLFAETLATL